jgi:hypothetical protein
MMAGNKNKTQLILQRSESSKRFVLQTVNVEALLSYWKWGEFALR